MLHTSSSDSSSIWGMVRAMCMILAGIYLVAARLSHLVKCRDRDQLSMVYS
jgi:hypothetical protein